MKKHCPSVIPTKQSRAEWTPLQQKWDIGINRVLANYFGFFADEANTWQLAFQWRPSRNIKVMLLTVTATVILKPLRWRPWQTRNLRNVGKKSYEIHVTKKLDTIARQRWVRVSHNIKTKGTRLYNAYHLGDLEGFTAQNRKFLKTLMKL